MANSKDDREPTLRSGNDYDSVFDPNAYLTLYYSDVEGYKAGLLQFRLKTLHEIFSTGRASVKEKKLEMLILTASKIKGTRLLDIGTGPCIHSVISASKWFDEITLTDFADVNRRALKKWWLEEDGAWNWDPFFKYVAKLDGNEGKWEKYREKLRKKIKDVLVCDVHKVNPISPHKAGRYMYDAITSCQCLEVASADTEAYKQAIKNVVSFLKVNGYFVLIGNLNDRLYHVGQETFFCLPLEKETVEEALEQAGLENITWCQYDVGKEDDEMECILFVASATKKAVM
ncbi:indolethylamine N-methyltransferase-like [Lingula anatina]|uniref:Indolethylamine N-methyltransferase-like n=1 Tax=Lingula anatina TaxID=7574 RepID=A0A1S3HR44_LINAN|nr:indolethylamine N-methyltransferase-like [Lingula anatina]|eukprot:XP_013388507.1 indolethylamine N-methyltransferase-like [Lingula anatina]